MVKISDLCSNFESKKSFRRRRGKEDRISSLPDGILLLILSLLSVKEAVMTSLLSRRWLNLWVHTSVLDILAPAPDPEGYRINEKERQDFIEYVNHVLRRHQCPSLKKFRMVCDLDNSYHKDIESWLVFAFSRKVECLELRLRRSIHYACMENRYVFPCGFLDINSCDKARFMQFDLKRLKSLSFERVDVTGEAINFILINCPFLEQLEVVDNRMLANLVISDPNLVLKYLKIVWCCKLKVLVISNFNLVSLEIPSLYNGLTLANLPMLVELTIQGTSEDLSHSLSQASSGFPQLERFTLMGIFLMDAYVLSNTDRFTKLKRLVILGRAFSDESLTKFISIINSFPRLEEFVMKVLEVTFRVKPGSKIYSTSMNQDVDERCGSSLKSKSLKVFEFFGYYGRHRDVEFIMHLVDAVVGLEKIVIDLTAIKEAKKAAARKTALRQLDSLRKRIPPHVHLHIR